MEDIANTPSQPVACRHPEPNKLDRTDLARPGDQYTTRHNPFMYFHSILDNDKYCQDHDVPLTALANDLSSLDSAPNFAFITPNLCHDGHDPVEDAKDFAGLPPQLAGKWIRLSLRKKYGWHQYPEHTKSCVDHKEGGLKAVGQFLNGDLNNKGWIQKIMESDAYKDDGMIIITVDEADTDDTQAYIPDMTGGRVTKKGGGGKVGALVISNLVTPGCDDHPYNHYALLRSIEELFVKNTDGKKKHLGLADQPGLQSFSEVPGFYKN